MALETVYLYSAIGGGAVLLIQLASMLLGLDDGLADAGDPGIDIDIDGTTDGSSWFFEMLSLRTIAAAATLFGLVGGVVNSAGQPVGVSLGLALVAGYSAMYFVYWAFKQLFKLEVSGAQDINNAVGLTGQVYVPIAPAGGQAGKVHLSMQGRTVEYLALTDSEHPLATGTKVVVRDIVSHDTVKVAPADATS